MFRSRIQIAAPPIAAIPVNPSGPLSAANVPVIPSQVDFRLIEGGKKANHNSNRKHSAPRFAAEVDQKRIEGIKEHQKDRCDSTQIIFK